jgi:hypothetical protein
MLSSPVEKLPEGNETHVGASSRLASWLGAGKKTNGLCGFAAGAADIIAAVTASISTPMVAKTSFAMHRFQTSMVGLKI